MRTELPADRVQRRLTLPHGDPDDGVENRDGGGDNDGDNDGDESDTALSRWLPDDKAPGQQRWIAAIRADPGRAGVIGLAVVGVVAVLVTVFTILNDRPPPVVSAKLPPVQMVSSTSPTTGTSGPNPDAPVVVSVVGLVKKPGLVTLTPGMRVSDAVDAAGGPLDGADLIGLNMARKVADGEQILVGIASPAGVTSVMGSSISSSPSGVAQAPPVGGTATAPGHLVDLNAATLEQFETLPGVGPVTAAAIIAWRNANGRFTNVEQLGEVDGIGPARLAKLHDLVHV
jgi:competence protein ComEA